MSTNFYVVGAAPPLHVGKRYGAGDGTLGFIWAMPPGALEGVLAFEDEYDSRYTRAEFLEILEGCRVQEFDSIGRDFT